MCGIAGLLNFDGRPVEAGVLDSMLHAVAHRGPDGEDRFVDGPVALGHRRLAIIDLETGRQPMRNDAGDAWLVANGEIYNYRELRAELQAMGFRFRTNSDCETILHGYAAWGLRVVDRLRGMFAFALWDARTQQLVLARDRVGIKPICYMQEASRFAFASEIGALTTLPGFDGSMDEQALDNYLHLQYIPAPRTIYRNVRKLEPGRTMVVGADGRVQDPKRYWRFQWRPDSVPTEQQWCDELDAALSDAVRSHLVADVPFGAFLSGGVDSSTVVAYAAREATPLRTFTIGFDTPEFDEREPASEFARIAGTDHREEVVGLDALSLLPQLVRHYGEPFADSSAVCTWRVCEAARRHVPMVLSGDGGDETQAGYGYFPKLVESYPDLNGRVRRLRRLAGDILRRSGALAAAPDLVDSWYGRSPWFGEPQRQRLWRPERRDLVSSTRRWNEAQFVGLSGLDTLSRCQQVDIETYLPNNNLTKVDIASMAHGLEVRVPLLDHKLLDVVARMPSDMRLRRLTDSEGGTQWCGKYALKRVASRFYPWESLTAPKRGFSVPVAQWLGGSNKPAVRERILASDARLGDWFDAGYMRQLVDEHGVSHDHGHRLWSLLVMAEWQRQRRA